MLVVLNCGSSTVKLAAFSASLHEHARVTVERPGTEGIQSALAQVDVTGITAFGHRIVHGGEIFTAPVRITSEVCDDLRGLTPLAPVHQPHNIAGIEAVSRAFPGILQVACFDTSFHRTIPEHRQKMPLPQKFAAQGLLRYGFHGLSYQHVARAIPVPKLIACHLGNGCSIAAIAGGKSIYTSMGFTPLDGLMMGTRSGSLDPGAVLWLVEKLGAAAAGQLLNNASGLLGVSGLSADMRVLLDSREHDAELAIRMFTDHVVLEIGRAAAALEGVDAIAFTGGIGENAAPVRKAITERLAWLGNPAIHVVRANEERVIAEATHHMLSAASHRK